MRVSVGLPFLNAARTLGSAIRSIFAQSFEDWELILLDDGSSDTSLEVASEFVDPRVRIVSDGYNRGLSYRLNQSAHLARGTYLARMDADDLMHPDRLRLQVRFFEQYPETDLLGTGAFVIDAAGNLIGKRGHQTPDFQPLSVLERGLFVHPTVMGRTEWFRTNPYSVVYTRAEDHELWCRVAATARLGHLPDLLMFYRESDLGSMRKYAGSAQTNRRIFRQYGWKTAGSMAVFRLLLFSLAKEGVFRLMHACEQQRHLMALRNTPLDAGEILHGDEILLRLFDNAAARTEQFV